MAAGIKPSVEDLNNNSCKIQSTREDISLDSFGHALRPRSSRPGAHSVWMMVCGVAMFTPANVTIALVFTLAIAVLVSSELISVRVELERSPNSQLSTVPEESNL